MWGARRSSRLHAMAGVVVLVALVAGLMIGAWRWRHPQILDTGGSSGFAGDPRPLNNYPWLAPVADAKDAVSEMITVRRVHARFSSNTAKVTAKFVVCRRHIVKKDDLKVVGFITLGANDSLDDFCSQVREVDPGTRLQLHGFAREGGDYLVAVLTPRRPGAAHLRGLDVTYSRDARHLWQRGTQHVDQDLLIRISGD